MSKDDKPKLFGMEVKSPPGWPEDTIAFVHPETQEVLGVILNVQTAPAPPPNDQPPADQTD